MKQYLHVPLLSLLIFALLSWSGTLSRLDDFGLDMLFRLRGPLPPNQRIVIIGVDEASLQQLGPWPFPRRLHAQLLGHLHQARAIGFDVLFSEPDADDSLFSKALTEGPPVIFSQAHDRNGNLMGVSSSLHGFTGIGNIETQLSGDGIIRHINLSTMEHIEPFAEAMLRAAGITVDLPGNYQRAFINYYGPEDTYLWLSYAAVLDGKIPDDFFQNRLVLIGAKAMGLGDTHVTPYTREFPTPGVEIQATIIANLLDHSFIRPCPSFLVAGIIIVVLMSVLLWPKCGERINLLVNFCFTLLILLVALILFFHVQLTEYLQVLFFLALTYPVHLLNQLLLTARRILIQVRNINRELDAGLQIISKNLPPLPIISHNETLLQSTLQRHLDLLQSVTQALRLQHHFLDNLLKEELPPMILWTEQNDAPVFANTAFNRLWATLTHQSQTLPTVSELLAAIGHADAQRPFHDMLDFEILTLKGRRYHQAVFHPLVVPKTGFQGLLAISQDITEIKELERSKDEVVAIVSHELKLPLTTILGYGEMLTDSSTGQQHIYAEHICSQARRLQHMIADFLDIARLESGRQQVRRMPFPPGRMMNDAVEALTPRAAEKHIRLVLKQPNRTSPFIGDEALLLQAVLNLGENAIKFSPEHTEITFILNEEADHFEIRVADQGPGIPPGEHERIFDKFQRGTQASAAAGFGLGLHLVRQIVERHQGSIVALEVAHGSVFLMTLPKYNEEKTIDSNQLPFPSN